MHTQIVRKPGITLTGISARTTNAEEAGPNGVIPGLWGQFSQANLAEATGASNPHLTYGLYTDYESDFTGAYTILLGHEHGSAEIHKESGFAHAVVPESNYMVFTTVKGPMEVVVPQAWAEIWKYFKDSPEKRTYTGDFELYDARKFDAAGVEVQIYIAVE
ncbi:GyrI-like domain-containing protein [Paenibacillus agri]|uniref:AraC family transcriptional regulator n=1 Tax=Paenibacillus agri TaxID=2744309 RepID=A0A850ETE3_9BACL|nr:GyrI-like domain-containing protein [Paenibacillus agri]NUU62959.1 AraC family transcriptional regulator [Paenibacillus agri]